MDLLDNIATELGFEFHLYIVRDELFGAKQRRSVKDYQQNKQSTTTFTSTTNTQTDIKVSNNKHDSYKSTNSAKQEYQQHQQNEEQRNQQHGYHVNDRNADGKLFVEHRKKITFFFVSFCSLVQSTTWKCA